MTALEHTQLGLIMSLSSYITITLYTLYPQFFHFYPKKKDTVI